MCGVPSRQRRDLPTSGGEDAIGNDSGDDTTVDDITRDVSGGDVSGGDAEQDGIQSVSSL